MNYPRMLLDALSPYLKFYAVMSTTMILNQPSQTEDSFHDCIAK